MAPAASWESSTSFCNGPAGGAGRWLHEWLVLGVNVIASGRVTARVGRRPRVCLLPAIPRLALPCCCCCNLRIAVRMPVLFVHLKLQLKLDVFPRLPLLQLHSDGGAQRRQRLVHHAALLRGHGCPGAWIAGAAADDSAALHLPVCHACAGGARADQPRRLVAGAAQPTSLSLLDTCLGLLLLHGAAS